MGSLDLKGPKTDWVIEKDISLLTRITYRLKRKRWWGWETMQTWSFKHPLFQYGSDHSEADLIQKDVVLAVQELKDSGQDVRWTSRSL